MEGCHLGDPTSMQGEDRRPAARRRGALSRAELEEIRTKAAEMVGGEVNKFCNILLRDNSKGSARMPAGIKLVLDEHLFKSSSAKPEGPYSDRRRLSARGEPEGRDGMLSERVKRPMGEQGRRMSRAVAHRALRIAGVVSSPVKRSRQPLYSSPAKRAQRSPVKDKKPRRASPMKQPRLGGGRGDATYFGDEENDPQWRLRTGGFGARNANAFVPCEGRVRGARLGFPGDIVSDFSKIAAMEVQMGGAKWEEWELECEEQNLWNTVRGNIEALDALVMASQRYHVVLDSLDIHQGSEFERMLERCRLLVVKCTDALRDEAAPSKDPTLHPAHDEFGIGERSIITGKLQKQVDRIRASVLALADAGKEHSNEVSRIEAARGGKHVMIRRAQHRCEQLLGPALAEASQFVDGRRLLFSSPCKPPKDPLRTVWGTPEKAYPEMECGEELGGDKGVVAGNRGWAVLRTNAALHKIIARKDKEDREGPPKAGSVQMIKQRPDQQQQSLDEEQHVPAPKRLDLAQMDRRRPLGLLQQALVTSARNVASKAPPKTEGGGGSLATTKPGAYAENGRGIMPTDRLGKTTRFGVERDSSAPLASATPPRPVRAAVPPLHPSGRLRASLAPGPATARAPSARPMFGRVPIRPASAKTAATRPDAGGGHAGGGRMLKSAGGCFERMRRSTSVPDLRADTAAAVSKAGGAVVR